MKAVIGPYKESGERKIKIRIDDFDTWNADHTIALIVVPLLKKLRETKHGSPWVDDQDVPDELKRTEDEIFKENTGGEVDDERFEARWEYVLGEMIWALEQIASESLIIDQASENRINTGTTLFGKYFRALWD